jgi:hypothetical protein
MAHEQYHTEEIYKIGFDKYVKDAPLAHVKEGDYTAKNWQSIIKEKKYVYDRLVQNAKKFNLNENEISNPPFGHAFQYLDGIILKMEKKNISIPKT